MAIHKNDLVTLTITDMSTDGEGIGKADGFTVFVKDAVIGDAIRAKIMKVKKTYGYGRLQEVLTPSPHRVAPPCPVARQCGGCQLLVLSYPEQLKFKEKKVRGHLERIGGFSDPPMEPIIGMEEPFRYRNKAQFPVGRSKDGRVITGFYAGRTHSIIENTRCLLGVPENERVLGAVLAYMKRWSVPSYDENAGTGLVRHVLIRKGFATGELMVCLILNGKTLPHKEDLVKRLIVIPGMTSISYNINEKRTNVILGEKLVPLWGEPAITDKIGDVVYRISPLSFYQVNPVQTHRLYGKALEYAALTGKETVWDLYCGIGTISLFLARSAKEVHGVEIVPAAIRDARENARLNRIPNAHFHLGKSEEILPQKYAAGEAAADVIVVDPPRKGCARSLLDTILAISPRRVVYVSCDSATLARDLKILCEGGYRLDRVCPVDMFPGTVSVETVVLLSHKKTDSVINVKVEFGEGEGKVPLDNIAKRAAAYITEVKRELGLPMYDAPNAVEELKHPTAEKVEAIKEALRHFEII